MIRLDLVVAYIGLSQKCSAAKVEATSDHIVLNRKLFTSFYENFYSNTFDIFFTYVGIHRGIENPMTAFLKLTFH